MTDAMETTSSATYNNKDGGEMKEAISLNDITLIQEQVFQDGDALLLVELQQKLKAQNKNVTRLEEENLKLQKSLEEFTKITKTKKRRLEDNAEQDETNRLKEKIKILETRLDEREEELHELREKVAESEWSDYKNEANKTMNEGKSSSESQDSALLKSLEVILDKKFEDVDKKIASLDTKLAKVEMERTSIKDDLTKSFSTAVKQNLDESVLGNVITQAKNTDRIEETERARRETNIIIYGAPEQTNNTEQTQNHDEQYVSNMFYHLGCQKKPKTIMRLGAIHPDKPRPLKLEMSNMHDKEQVMKRLVNLKNAPDEYRKINVRDDLSVEERKLVKEWVKKAAKRNEEENTDEWRVRGTPKNGLRLVRLTKQRSQVPTSATPKVGTNPFNA